MTDNETFTEEVHREGRRRPARPEFGSPEERGGRRRGRRQRFEEMAWAFGSPRAGHREFESEDDEREPGGFGRGGFGGRFGFGPGFGPGGPGFGPGGPGGPGRGGRGGRGGWGPGGHGRGRRPRGNVRIAVLALLKEEPRHGYSIMTELAERSGGLWRPSPGSVYPVLQQLQDEGLVVAQESDGRKVFSLTDAGRELVEASPAEFTEPWNVTGPGPRERMQSLFQAGGGLAAATQQVARLGTPEQTERARAVLDEARRAMYRILAEDETQTTAGAEPEAADDQDSTDE